MNEPGTRVYYRKTVQIDLARLLRDWARQEDQGQSYRDRIDALALRYRRHPRTIERALRRAKELFPC